MRALPLSFVFVFIAGATALAQGPAPKVAGPDGKPVERNANPCRDEVAAALTKLRKSSWFRMTTQMVSEQGPTAMVVDYVLPDRMYQKVTRKLTGETSEVILVGVKAWANQGKGWTALPYDIASNLRSQMYDSVVAQQEEVGEYACTGKTNVDGREALSYKLTQEQTEESQRNDAYRMFYVDAVTGLPLEASILAKGRETAPLFKAVYSYPLDMKIEPPKDVVGPEADAKAPSAGAASSSAGDEKK